MSYTNENTHETWAFSFRKKFKKISALAAAATTKVVWKPQPGRTFILEQAYFKKRTVEPSNAAPSTPPQIKLTNGTTDVVVATVVPVATDVLRLAVAGNATFDNANPLTLVQSVAAAGGTAATTWDYDLILVATKLTD